jgi:hypothetical protein
MVGGMVWLALSLGGDCKPNVVWGVLFLGALGAPLVGLWLGFGGESTRSASEAKKKRQPTTAAVFFRVSVCFVRSCDVDPLWSEPVADSGRCGTQQKKRISETL